MIGWGPWTLRSGLPKHKSFTVSDTRLLATVSRRAGYYMGKGRDRGPRRRGFDDDFYAPSPSREERPQRSLQLAPRENAAPSGPAIDAVVKWFAPDKGFGFVELADGSGDAFLHVAVLQAAGHDAVEPETKLSVQVGQGQKGRQVTAV